MSKSGQIWTLPAQLGQLKTGQDGKGLLQIHLWCPDNLPRLWDSIENRIVIIHIYSSFISSQQHLHQMTY